VSFLSQTVTLEPGDVIATGTPPGVGFARKPPVFLKPGDQMEVLIEGMGGLGNSRHGCQTADQQGGWNKIFQFKLLQKIFCDLFCFVITVDFEIDDSGKSFININGS